MQLERTFGTAAFTTVIRPDADGTHSWERVAPAGSPIAFALTDGAAQWCAAASTSQIRFVAPVHIGTQDVRWKVRGRATLASLIHPAGEDGADSAPDPAELRKFFSALGAATPRTVDPHTVRPSSSPATPDALYRLVRWFAGEWNVGASSCDRDILKGLIGKHLFGRLQRITENLASLFGSDAAETAVHGSFTSGHIILEPGALEICDVLSGIDLTPGPASYDPGILLGDLCEHYHVALAAGLPYVHFRDLARAYLAGAGLQPHGQIADAMITRIVGHIVDYSSFVGSATEIALYRDLIHEIATDPWGWLEE